MRIAAYVTPYSLRQHELNSSNEQDDNLLSELCLEASRDFESLCGSRVFYPYKATKYFDHPGGDLRHDEHATLRLYDDLLQVVTFKTDDGTELIASTDYFLRQGSRGRYDESPYDRMQLEYGTTGYATNFQWSNTPQRANEIVGFWGYVPGWTGAVATHSCWLDSNANVTSAASGSLTVDSLAGVNAIGLYPRVTKYDLVMWFNTTYADMEMGFVTAVAEDTGVLTVTRGVNGTSTDTPSGSPSLYVFRPPGDIVHAVRRLAAYYYRARQTSRGDIDRPIITATGTVVMPSSLPKDVVETVHRYQGILE